jgi:NarL family two-component system response regulator YdfI
VDLIRIAILAAGMAVRAGLRVLVSEDPDVQVITEGALAGEPLPDLHEADVVIWSPAPGAELATMQAALSRLKLGEAAALLVISSDPRWVDWLASLPVRAWGMLDPESGQAELLAGLHAVHEGLAVIDPVWLRRTAINRSAALDEMQEVIAPLTERELEILQLLAYGLTNKQIAARLKISAHTVKFHVSSIFSKLGTTNRVETVNLGLKKGLIVL